MGLLLVSALLGCRTVASPAPTAAQTPPRAPLHLTLVGTNDLHGWVEPHRVRLKDGRTIEQGGLETFSGYVSILRAENPGGVVLLDAGDLFQGTLISNLSEGEVVIEAYNRLGYLASALGNHEFDYGPVGPHAVAVRPAEDPFGALRARVAQAHFPFLAGNVYDVATGRHPSWLGNDGTLLTEVHGIKVGVVGLSTVSTPQTTNPANVVSLRFTPLAAEAKRAAERLRQRGADVLVLIAHAGAKCDSLEDPHELSGCDPKDAEVFDALAALPPHTFDAVIAGHTHQPVGKFVADTPVIETSALGRSFGVVDLWVDPARHRVLRDRTQLRAEIPVCAVETADTHRCDPKAVTRSRAPLVPATFHGRTVVRDAAMAALIEPYSERVHTLQERSTGVRVAARLGRSYAAESALGDVLADALRTATHADVALLNPGGLRADLPAGPLTYGALYEVLPFDNTVAVVSVRGDALERLLQVAYEQHRGVFQESGLRVRLAACPGKGRLLSARLADGAPIRADQTYRVAMPDFLARGGGGLGGFMRTVASAQIDLGDARESIRDVLLEHWASGPSVVEPPETGRVAIAPGRRDCPSEPDAP